MNGRLLILPILKQFIELLDVLQHHLSLLLLVGVIILKRGGHGAGGPLPLLPLPLGLFLSSSFCINKKEIPDERLNAHTDEMLT